MRLLILLLHWWELQREPLAASAIKLQLPRPSPQDRCNDGSVIRVMEPRLLYRNILEKLSISIPCHAVIWLGLVPLSPPLLPPSPSPPSCRPSHHWRNFWDILVRLILSSRSTIISSHSECGDPKFTFKSPSSSGLQFVGHLAQVLQRSSTPVVSAGGMYAAPITKYRTPPVISWKVRMFEDLPPQPKSPDAPIPSIAVQSLLAVETATQSRDTPEKTWGIDCWLAWSLSRPRSQCPFSAAPWPPPPIPLPNRF
jgi:hypothetical protein